MRAYRRSQIGYPIIIIAAVLAVILTARQVTFERSPIFLGSLAVLIGVVVMFGRLTVEVDAHRLQHYFGAGFIRRTVPLEDIADWRPVKHSWYHGYGVRRAYRTVVYTVSGTQAVEFTLRSGRSFRIGTSEPARLCEAIAAHGGRRMPAAESPARG